MELLQTRLPFEVETQEKDDKKKNKRPKNPKSRSSIVAPPLFDIEQVEIPIEIENKVVDINKLLKVQEKFKAEIELKLGKIELKARKFYVYLAGEYSLDVANRYLDLVSSDKYLRRNPVIKDSIELEEKEVA